MTDFTMFAGDTKTLEFTVRDAAGAIVDITDYDVRWHASRNVNARPALIEKSLGSGIEMVDGGAGRFDVSLENADTESLRGEFYHEAELTLDDEVYTVDSGSLTIRPTLIKPEPEEP